MVSHLLDLELDPAGTARPVLVGNGQSIELSRISSWATERQSSAACMATAAARTQLGIAGLRYLIRWAMEQLDVDEFRIEGATRTSGAGPGRRPATLIFRRGGSTRPTA